MRFVKKLINESVHVNVYIFTLTQSICQNVFLFILSLSLSVSLCFYLANNVYPYTARDLFVPRWSNIVVQKPFEWPPLHRRDPETHHMITRLLVSRRPCCLCTSPVSLELQQPEFPSSEQQCSACARGSPSRLKQYSPPPRTSHHHSITLHLLFGISKFKTIYYNFFIPLLL